MKKFILLSYGYTTPTPEIMAAWGKWFASIKDNILEKGHFPRGAEISRSGVVDLPLGPDSITGYVVLRAETLEDAQRLAKTNPYIKSVRVYEVMSG